MDQKNYMKKIDTFLKKDASKNIEKVKEQGKEHKASISEALSEIEKELGIEFLD